MIVVLRLWKTVMSPMILMKGKQARVPTTIIADLQYYRQDFLVRSYNELICRIPLVKTLAEQDDIDALQALYKNVCISLPLFITSTHPIL